MCREMASLLLLVFKIEMEQVMVEFFFSESMRVGWY